MMVEMRKDGASYRQIADATGSSHMAAKRAVETSGVTIVTPEEIPSIVTGKDGKQYPAKQKTKQDKPAPQHGLFAATEKQQDGYLGTLQKAKVEAPDVYESLAAGEMKMAEAHREMRHRQIENAPSMPTDKYRVIYADPPWHYSNSGATDSLSSYTVLGDLTSV